LELAVPPLLGSAMKNLRTELEKGEDPVAPLDYKSPHGDIVSIQGNPLMPALEAVF
jgi:hypothetical protein